MFVAAGSQSVSISVFIDAEQAWLGGERPDLAQRLVQRLVAEQFVGRLLRHSQNQLEIFSVGKGVIEGCRAVVSLASQLVRGGGDGNVFQIEYGAAAASFAQAEQIERQAVADVDSRVNSGVLREPQRFPHTRREVEMLSDDAAAKLARDENRIAGPCA